MHTPTAASLLAIAHLIIIQQELMVELWLHSSVVAYSSIGNSFFGKNKAGNNSGVMGAYFNGSITVSNSSFDNNTAGVDGGVMAAFFSSSISIGNSFFGKNKAGNNGGVMGAYSNSSITVGNSSFDNNVAFVDGGVMAAYFSSSISIGNSFFGKNKAGNNGGVMDVYSNSSITVGNSAFDNNAAARDGGVMAAYFSSKITVSNSSFNSSVGDDGGVMIAFSNSKITVGNSSFHNNVAFVDGGVMAAFSNSSITIGNSSLKYNIAIDDGGVIYAHGSGSSITVENGYLDNNRAGANGGVANAWNTSSISVGSSYFNSSEAGNSGGVLHAQERSSITVGNSSFVNNKADNSGGVMAADSYSNITVGNSSFERNEADNNGGVMVAYFSSWINVSISSFDNNKADRRGGVAYGYSSTTRIMFNKNCTLLNNLASEGGVVYLQDAVFRDLGNLYCENMAINGGVITLNGGIIEVTASRFVNNSATNGGVLYTPLHHHNNVSLKTSIFINNSADSGGAIALLFNATVTVTDCVFTYNSAVKGGAIYLLDGNNLTTSYSNFTLNLAESDGGVIYLESQNRLKFKNCELKLNRADNNGGVVGLLFKNEFNITGDNTFIGNQARSRGIAYIKESITNIHSQTLLMANNTAIENGGAIYSLASNLTFFSGNHELVENETHNGGAIFAEESIICVNAQSLLMINNNFATAIGGAVHMYKSNLTFLGNSNTVTLVQNQAHSGGALYASESKVKAYNVSLQMINNIAGGAVHLFKTNLSFISDNDTFEDNDGGAIHLNEGQLLFSGGSCMLVGNIANDGGALYISNSKLIVENDSQTVAYANLAAHHGGGLYLTKSELMIRGGLNISRNRAKSNGGGIHATNSSIIIEQPIVIIGNIAANGGGISLETNTRLRGTLAEKGHINFIQNQASHYGGAIYVDDETNPDVCAAVNIQSVMLSTECFSNSVFINVSNNYARMSGSNPFKGLLDRCSLTVHSGFLKKIDMNNMYSSGIISFLNSSNINKPQLDTIASHPVKLCFCRDSKPNCSYQPEPIQINRGENFSIEVIAYDQVHHAVSTRIQCHHNLSAGGLGEGQWIQMINKKCTYLKYKIFTSNDYAMLTISSIKDPCKNISKISKRNIMINIICTCPVGFQVVYHNGEVSCDCVCDPVLQLSKIIECNRATKSI